MKTVFVVDDNQTNLIAAKNALNGIYRTLTVASAERMFSLAEKIQPDIILLDIEMPEMDGFSAMKIIKENDFLCDVPVIFLTAQKDAEIEIKGFDLGAVDFITKPFSTPVLLKRIERHINSDEKLKEVKNSLKDISHVAFVDTMTGLQNRNSFLIKRETFITPECMPLGIVSADVNFLKRVNDTYGHIAGDRLLSVIAGAIRQSLPKGAYAARTGGDELVILIPAGGKKAADEFILKTDEILSLVDDEMFGTPSVSWGTAEMCSSDEIFDEVFATADERMYEDKKRRKAVRVD